MAVPTRVYVTPTFHIHIQTQRLPSSNISAQESINGWQAYSLLNMFSNSAIILRKYACMTLCKHLKCHTKSCIPKSLMDEPLCELVVSLLKRTSWKIHTTYADLLAAPICPVLSTSSCNCTHNKIRTSWPIDVHNLCP